ncbi:MAG: hypothetical protein G01um101466_446 [Parcubacteria group bacterium Gr01-1014_66]|nr:MAG: hypothetical protein G01um101466_446 [Parcubacteria group bacterium Gr01-1014_66]
MLDKRTHVRHVLLNMQFKTRRLLFYFLCFVFLLSGPLLLAYATGAIFNLSSWTLEKKGGVFVYAHTPRVRVLLDNEVQKITGPLSGETLFTDVAPGLHVIRVEKAAHHSWSKIIEVHPFIVTELWNVLLVPFPFRTATTTPLESHAIEEELSQRSREVNSASFTLDKKNQLIGYTATSSVIRASNVHSFHANQNFVWYVDRNGFLARMNRQDSSIDILGRPGFVMTKTSLRFAEPVRNQNGDEIVILDSEKGLYTIEEQGAVPQPTGTIEKMFYSRDGRRLFLIKEKSIELLWRKDNRTQPFQTKNTREVIASTTTPILEAFLLYTDDGHLVLRTKEGVFLVDIEAQSVTTPFPLLEEKVEQIFTLDTFPAFLFVRRGNVWFAGKFY